MSLVSSQMAVDVLEVRFDIVSTERRADVSKRRDRWTTEDR